jgi:hypothetical protein
MPPPNFVEMTWDIQYSRAAVDQVDTHGCAESAIEAACALIDDGCCVYGIWIGDLTEALDPVEIARVYASRANSRTEPLALGPA